MGMTGAAIPDAVFEGGMYFKVSDLTNAELCYIFLIAMHFLHQSVEVERNS